MQLAPSGVVMNTIMSTLCKICAAKGSHSDMPVHVVCMPCHVVYLIIDTVELYIKNDLLFCACHSSFVLAMLVFDQLNFIYPAL